MRKMRSKTVPYHEPTSTRVLSTDIPPSNQEMQPKCYICFQIYIPGSLDACMLLCGHVLCTICAQHTISLRNNCPFRCSKRPIRDSDLQHVILSLENFSGTDIPAVKWRAEAEVSAKMLCAEQSSCRLQRQINSIEKTLNKQKNSINRHHSTLKNAAEEADALSQKLTATHMNLRRADGVVNELRSSLRQLEFRNKMLKAQAQDTPSSLLKRNISDIIEHEQSASKRTKTA